ncbi:MAG: type II toxin-antitoxin system RelE/ParE family toxin [Sedimenticola sp.]
MTRVVFTPESSKDLKDIVRYTRETWGSVQAVEYVSGLRKQSALLAQRPDVGKKRDDLADGLLCFPYVSHIVYYTKIHDGIAIIRFLHKQQDPTIHIGQGGNA